MQGKLFITLSLKISTQNHTCYIVTIIEGKKAQKKNLRQRIKMLTVIPFGWPFMSDLPPPISPKLLE